MSERSTHLSRAAALMVASALLFALMGLAVRLASAELPNTMVVFFRNALGLVVLLVWVQGVRRIGLRTSRLGDHVVRSISGLLAMYCFFYAIAHMPLAIAMSLNYSMPLFLPLIERAWIKEPIPRGLWPGLALGFTGVLLILKPGTQLFQPLALIAVGAAVLASLAQVGIRRLTATEPPARIVFYFGLIATLVSSIPLAGTWRTPSPRLWLVLLAIGVLATIAQLTMTQAFGLAPAALVGPFIYAAVPAAAVLDLVAWRRLPDGLSLLGTLLVTAAGVLTLRLRTE
jgi:drug/metabolite transporter (DMT)-like permease